ncbi:MAG: SprT-like domain-containing protein [Planctomycetota bacterium]|jgi:predicted SprT family Zn-dependent metalloprotease
MARQTRSLSRELAAGQLLLFGLDPAPEKAPDGTLPDLDALFRELNDRFFAGRLEARCEWSRRLTASAGTCRPEGRLIRISVPYHERRPDVLAMTLAHEMCHLVVPGHGADFRRLAQPIARALGISWHDFRYAEKWADLTRYRYVYACPRCGLEYPSRKRRRVSCGSCSPSGYDEACRLVLTESRARPGPVLLGLRPVQSNPR